MYAVLKDSIVIDFGSVNENKIYSILPSKDIYDLTDEFQIVEMTIENSPASFNMKYDGKKFTY